MRTPSLNTKKQPKHLWGKLGGRTLQTLLIIIRPELEVHRLKTSLLPLFPERSRVTSSPRSRPSLWKGKENSHRPTAAAARKSCESGWRKKGESGGKRQRETPDVKSRTVRKKGRPAHISKRLFVKVSSVRACLNVLVAATHVN